MTRSTRRRTRAHVADVPYLRGVEGVWRLVVVPGQIDQGGEVQRLGAALWRVWKTPRRRRAALLRLGVRRSPAGSTAGCGYGPWHLARSPALAMGLSNAYFRSLGLPSLVEGC